MTDDKFINLAIQKFYERFPNWKILHFRLEPEYIAIYAEQKSGDIRLFTIARVE
jgi:hypothetical protein